ncbi:MAG: septal ring lytic transglycosylase RlpA family protein [Sphingomonadales bacterium]|nr:septal ring lytic transglycosylase RlpA family protein [Sphingomonadales bacterium]
MQQPHAHKTRYKLLLLALTSQFMVGCAAVSAVKGVAGLGYDVVSAPFKVAAWMIPDGDATEAPGPLGTDDNPKIGRPYQIAGRWYTPKVEPNYTEVGFASWYGPQFHGKDTANGEVFDMNQLTAAHRTLPLPSYVRVTNLSNGRSVVLRVNDRGPFANERILDVSRRGAQMLGFEQKGVQRVRVEVVDPSGRSRAENRTDEPERSVQVAAAMEYFVQVASFNNRQSANRLLNEIDDVVDNSYVESASVRGDVVYRVRVGPFSAERTANRALTRIKRQGHGSARVFSNAAS